MEDKGQISAEYLLLIVVILVILNTVTIPLIGQSIDAANDVAWTFDAKVAVTTIANAVNIVHANGPGARRTLEIYIPRGGMNLQYNNRSSLVLSNNIPKPVNSTVNYPVTINTATLNSGWHKVTVHWSTGITSINVNLTKT